MKLKVNKEGRLLIPAPVRKDMNIVPPCEVHAYQSEDGSLIIQPAAPSAQEESSADDR